MNFKLLQKLIREHSISSESKFVSHPLDFLIHDKSRSVVISITFVMTEQWKDVGLEPGSYTMVVREGELLSLKRTEELEYVRVLERKLIDLPDNFGQPVELVRHGPMGAIFYEEYKKSEGR